VCGILCEGIGDAVVVGIGVNVEQEADDFPETLRADAISLGMAAGRAVPRGQLAGRILHELQTVLSHPTFRLEGPLFEAVRRRDVLREVSVEVTGGPEGVARGIDATGALLVDTGDGRPVRVVAGSVRRSGRTPGRESSA
jgi:BirA family biotin operon repressor/biotin-[acetyl-CoA-carboxylase] ligase